MSDLSCLEPYVLPDGPVAILALLDDTKRDLLRGAQRETFPQLDLGGRERVWIVAANDANAETQAALEAAVAPAEVVWVLFEEDFLAELPAKHNRACADDDDLSNHLTWMAFQRESVREVMLETTCQWGLWWDVDIRPQHPETAFHELRAVLTETVGPHAPKLASGIFPDRHRGALQGQYWRFDAKPATGERKTVNPPALHYVPGKTVNPRGVTPVGLVGFGFLLMHRRTLERFAWSRFDEIRPVEFGEDCYAQRVIEAATGDEVKIVGTVPCAHYRDDETWWECFPHPEVRTWTTAYRGFRRRTLTVAVAAANRDLRLPLQTAAAQLEAGDELLVLDGGGNQWPWPWADGPDRPDFLRILFHKLNGGPFPEAALKNRLLAKCQTEDLLWINADILLPPGRLDTVRQQLAAQPTALLWASLIDVDPETAARWRAEGQHDNHYGTLAPRLGAYGDFCAARVEKLRDLTARDGFLFDEAFTGWGGLDDDLHDRWPGLRIQCGPVYHLDHARDLSRQGENWALLRRRRMLRAMKRQGNDHGQ